MSVPKIAVKPHLYALAALFCAVNCVICVVRGDALFSAVNAAGAVGWWKNWLAIRREAAS